MKVARLSAVSALSAWMLLSSIQTSAQMPVPPPVEQLTADCARPVFASDHLVCADRELREIDLKLSQALRQYAALPPTHLIENNSQWFKRRSLCAFKDDHRGCLLDAYRDRVSIIESVAMTPVRSLAARCKSLGRVSLGTMSNGQMLVRSSGTNALIAIASALAEASPWKPMASFTERSRIFKITSHDGQKLSCRATSKT